MKTIERQDIRDELEAVLQARRELSPEEEKFLVEDFLRKIDADIDARIDARLAQSRPPVPAHRMPAPPIIILSLVFAIPLSAIAGGIAGPAGIFLTWAAILSLIYLTSR